MMVTLIEHGPNGDCAWDLESRSEAEAKTKERQEFWRGFVEVNKAPPRTWTIRNNGT